jgi:hypothetical protein
MASASTNSSSSISNSNNKNPSSSSHAPLSPSKENPLMKQRSRSADALDLLKDGPILEEAAIVAANTGEATTPATTTNTTTTNTANNPPVLDEGITSNNNNNSSSALDVTAIAERHQQEQLEEAWDTLAILLQRNMIQQKHVTVFQTLCRENVQWKEKVTKLKSLLARSAKVQKDVSFF